MANCIHNHGAEKRREREREREREGAHSRILVPVFEKWLACAPNFTDWDMTRIMVLKDFFIEAVSDTCINRRRACVGRLCSPRR